MTSTHFKRLGVLAFGAALTAAVAVQPAAAETALERVTKEGVVRIGFANEAPYGYQTPDGKVTGEAPEVAKAVLAKMGITKIEGVVTEFGSLIPGLKAGRFDMIAAGMYVTPPRCKEVNFSEPSYSIGEAFAVATGNPKKLHSYEDVKANPDVKLGVMAGAVESGYAKDIGIPESQLVFFPDGPSAVAAVRTGRADAYAGTALTIQDLTSKNPKGVERAEPFTDPVINGKSVRGYGAFGFRKEDESFRDAFTKHLMEYRGSPEHLALVEPFGFTKSEMPDKTKAELCAGK